MTSKLTIAKVGGGVIDLTGFTGRKGVPFFDGNNALIEMGMRFANGEASQGSFKVMDPDAEIARADFAYNLPAHKIVTWTEDAPGPEIWLARGRAEQYDGGRGVVAVDNQVEYDVQVDDGNIELRGQAFTEEWPRPEERDTDRLYALQDYTLNGASSSATNFRATCEVTVADAHLAPDSAFVIMPAKVYPVGTQPQDVVQDCADTAGKVYGVVIHHDGGSHLCLQYIVETDHTTNASAIKISDNLADWDPEDATAPVYEPHWEAGKATQYRGQETLSGLVSIYGIDQSVFVENPANVTDYDYAVDTYYDAESETAAQAIARAESLLLYRSLTRVTHRVSIIMQASQLDLLATGMSLEIKAAAAIAGQYLDIYQTRRVVECKFQPRFDGTYWANLELDRASRRGAYSAGSGPTGGGQPAATTPPGPPIPPVDDDCLPAVCTLVPTAWIQAPSASWPDMTTIYSSGAITTSAIVGEDASEGIYYQTAGTMFPPLLAGDGQLRGSVTLPVLDATCYGATIQIILRTPASGSVNGAGIYILQANGAGGFPFSVAQVRGSASDRSGFPSSTVSYLGALSGIYKYAIRFCDGTCYVKLWPAGVVEPSTWEGPGNYATPNEVRIWVNVAGANFSDDFTWHFTRPTWCYPDGTPLQYYYVWTAATYVETANGTTATFSIPADLNASNIGAVNAYVNGVYEPSTFDSVARTFTFANIPEEGDIIDVAWIPIP